jgi:hypothetical protein
LLPKVQVADKLQAFGPIFLIKVILKISTKVLNYREVKVANNSMLEFQIAFKGRCILEGFFLLHEIHISKKAVVLFKVDFENFYDKLDNNFFFQILLMKGFDVKFVDWVKVVVNDGSVAVMINDQMVPYFINLRGVKHRDPLSPVDKGIVNRAR